MKSLHSFTSCLKKKGIFSYSFSLDECKTTKDDPCIFPMTYKGESVSMCIKSGNRYWCGTELKANNQYKKWGWCNDVCPNPDKAGTTTSAPGLFIELSIN